MGGINKRLRKVKKKTFRNGKNRKKEKNKIWKTNIFGPLNNYFPSKIVFFV